jgi:hypothetical protein
MMRGVVAPAEKLPLTPATQAELSKNEEDEDEEDSNAESPVPQASAAETETGTSFFPLPHRPGKGAMKRRRRETQGGDARARVRGCSPGFRFSDEDGGGQREGGGADAISPTGDDRPSCTPGMATAWCIPHMSVYAASSTLVTRGRKEEPAPPAPQPATDRAPAQVLR